MLRDLTYKPSYSKELDDIANDFYIPSMLHAKTYDRISGFFGSTIYIIAWKAIKGFIENHGHIRIICSPLLTDDDQLAMERGYDARHDEIVRDSITREVKSLFGQEILSAPQKLLAFMIAEGIVDIKLATVANPTSASITRMFHDKVGIFADELGNCVGFRGSMNETYQGLASDGNIESIDVFPNWLNDREKKRAEDAAFQFNLLWQNASPGVCIYTFPDEARAILRKKVANTNLDDLLHEVTQSESKAQKWSADKRPNAKRPRQHQIDALESWVANGKQGILEHATGSGKTYTAMCAIRSEIEQGKSVLVLVPSIDLLSQWANEIVINIDLPNLRILLCGGGNNEWRAGDMLERWTAKNAQNSTIVLSTMDTAVTPTFLEQLSTGDHLFLVADEVHRLGSENRQKAFQIKCGSKLGLSATPKRYGDPEGSEAIITFFGGIIQPPYTLKDAIDANVLTRYFYDPYTVRLSPDEQEAWNALSDEIGRLIARSGGTPISTLLKQPSIKMKILARARILKNAEGKIDIAIQIIEKKFRVSQKWIVYCDNQKQLGQVLNQLLLKGYDAYEYHSEMLGDRKKTLSYFESHGGILVSIRCLDEGVDIPSTTHALILASSQNPREFIQRRGRILRRSPDKYFAHLYDVLVLPKTLVCSEEQDRVISIVESELARAIQFGEMAENPSCIAKLKNIAVDYGIDLKTVIEGGIEDGEE